MTKQDIQNFINSLDVSLLVEMSDEKLDYIKALCTNTEHEKDYFVPQTVKTEQGEISVNIYNHVEYPQLNVNWSDNDNDEELILAVELTNDKKDVRILAYSDLTQDDFTHDITVKLGVAKNNEE